MKTKEKTAPIGDAAVQARTGRNWKQWFAILDKAGARKMNHKEIVACLSKYKIGGWWRQMVTVTYEQQRGLREKYQTPGGYQISRSKTIAAPLNTLFKAWNDHKLRVRWLPQKGIVIRKATHGKSIRITWVDGRTSLEVNFYTKGNSKTQVTVQHTKLTNAADANRMQTFWTKNLDKLKDLLEA